MKDYEKHIVLLMPGFASNEEDTTCVPYLQNYVKSYSRVHGDDRLTIITFQYPFTRSAYSWNNIDVHSIGGSNSKFPFKILTWKKVVIAFKKIQSVQPVTTIHSFWLNECTLVGKYLSKKYKINFLATAMGQDCSTENRYLRLLNINDIYTVGLSHFLESRLLENAGKQVDAIIPFGLPDDIPNAQQQQRTIDILGVGSLVPVKNYSLFLKIIRNLKAEFPSLNIEIIGNQPDPKELKGLQRLIKEFHLESNVVLTGQVEPMEVLDHMQRSKILLHTSSFEGQALVFSEALSCGMTVVCFNVGRISAEKMIVCSNEEQMISELSKLLKDDTLDFHPLPQMSVRETVRAYHELYQKDSVLS
jgi:1,2-diacylglycerol 3-alpha-glucosyltransferase